MFCDMAVYREKKVEERKERKKEATGGTIC